MASSELPHTAGPRSNSWGNADTARTAVGVDVGFRTLVAAAPADGDVEAAFTIDGGHLADSVGLLEAVFKSFDAVDFAVDAEVRATVAAACWAHRLKGQLFDAAYRTVRWVRETHPGAVLVLEDLPRDVPLAAWWREGVAPQTWVVASLSRALVDVAVEAGLPVAHVDPAGTSVECHACGRRGEREGGLFWCEYDDCPVGVVDVDASAAVTIASRF